MVEGDSERGSGVHKVALFRIPGIDQLGKVESKGRCLLQPFISTHTAYLALREEQGEKETH